LPVTGIQLPLISAGGTSTATTLFMVGLMANAARHEPAAVAALRAGRADRMNRLLRLPLPEPYLPTRTETLRDRIRSRPPAARPAAKPATRARPAKAATGARSAKAATRARTAKPADSAVPRRAAPRGATPRRTAAAPDKRATRAVAKPRERAASADNVGRAQHSSGRGGQNGGASDSRRVGASKAHGIGRPRRSRTLEGQRYG
jgi:cell division protein FtsW